MKYSPAIDAEIAANMVANAADEAIYRGVLYDRPSKKNARFVRVSTETIMATTYPPIRWVVPGHLAEGLAILAGRQKLGKTWLAMDMALAKATGV